MKQLLTKSIPLLALLVSGMMQAQTPFWTENFANGIPASWSNTDGSGQNRLWTWCSNPAAGSSEAGCPSIFDDAINEQTPFKATTANNGFVTYDSDQYGQLNANHVGRLTTSAIDCSGKNQVFISFQTHIGVYTISAETGAILRVSTDNTTWTNYTIFPGLTTSVRWSDNPEVPIIDISATAASQSTVYIQWQWTGNYEYHWSIDDIALYDENPTPRHNMGISTFFYPPASFAQPVSQMATDTFAFYAELSNLGTQPQTNIVLKAAVETNTGEEIFSDSLLIPALAAGVVDSGFELTSRYAPELPVGVYTIRYTLRADSTDQRPADNEQSDLFVVTNGTFSKENGPTNAARPSSGGDYTVANVYTMSAGALDNYNATLAQISFATDPSELAPADVESTIYLFRVNDDVDPQFNNFETADFISNSMQWVGVANYTAPDTVQNYDLQTVELLDLNNGTLGVPLDKGARYLLAVGYAAPNDVVFHAYSEIVDNVFKISTLLYTDEWTGGFGTDYNPVIRMGISLVTTTDDKPLPDNTMKVFPNPARDVVNLAVNFDQPTDATVTIADLTGRVIEVQDYQGLTNNNLNYSIPQLASGTYLARIATAEGTLTKKFIVQK